MFRCIILVEHIWVSSVLIILVVIHIVKGLLRISDDITMVSRRRTSVWLDSVGHITDYRTVVRINLLVKLTNLATHVRRILMMVVVVWGNGHSISLPLGVIVLTKDSPIVIMYVIVRFPNLRI